MSFTEKFRVGRKRKRAILYKESGHEYIVFPQGKEEACQKFCNYLNEEHRKINRISLTNLIIGIVVGLLIANIIDVFCH